MTNDSSSSGTELTATTANGVRWITLNRPQAKNALTTSLLIDLARAFRAAAADAAARVVVLTGSGSAFSAGADLGELAAATDGPVAVYDAMRDTIQSVVRAVNELPKPYIAVVNGPAIGAGLDLALLADYRLASMDARVAESFINVGLIPGDGAAWLLTRVVRRSIALRMLWTGEALDAATAAKHGIFDELVHSREELLDTARDFAERLAAQPTLAVQFIKRAVSHADRSSLDDALELAALQQATVTSAPESRAAISAAIHKLAQRKDAR